MPSIKAVAPTEQAENWVASNPCPPNEDGAPRIAHWLFKSALAFKFRRLPPEEAHALIQKHMTREPRPREIEQAIERASNTSYDGNDGKKKTVQEFDIDLLTRISARVSTQIDSKWLADHSPLPVSGVKPSEFLDAIYQPGEFAFVTVNQKSKDGFIYSVGDSMEADELNQFVKNNTDGAWFLSCPVNGQSVNGSIRSEANLTSFRFAVVESDKAKIHRDLWLRALVQIRLPILAIYESASNPPSIHALVRVGAESKPEFEQIVQAGIKPQLVPVGACPGAFSATRLTRLPNVVRNDNQREQTLLYLNPRAEQKSILDQTLETK